MVRRPETRHYLSDLPGTLPGKTKEHFMDPFAGRWPFILILAGVLWIAAGIFAYVRDERTWPIWTVVGAALVVTGILIA